MKNNDVKFQLRISSELLKQIDEVRGTDSRAAFIRKATASRIKYLKEHLRIQEPNGDINDIEYQEMIKIANTPIW